MKSDVDGDLENLDTDRLEAEITTLAAHIAAATCRWLCLVGEFERREAWQSWDCKSCAHWLAWQCATNLRTAREHVRVGRALAELPAIRGEFANGRLSYSQVRALTRVARPENEAELVDLARHCTASQLDKLVRGYLTAEELKDEARESYERRGLTWWHDDDGSVVIEARLTAEDGALVLEALQKRADELRNPGSAEPRPAPRALLADALTDLARGDAPADDFQLVVNVDLETLTADKPGTCQLACGTVLAPETARRLGCDRAVRGAGGRKARFASKRLNRSLDQRDGGCRFPGCEHRRHLHTHHIIHWAHGGSTSAENLVRLCSHHHRLIHEGGYTVTGDPGGDLTFRNPDGRRLREQPPCPTGSYRDLTHLIRKRGIEAGAATLMPRWDGDGLDLDWAVSVLRL